MDELIERLEKAEGPDRELDIAIQAAVDPERNAWCEAEAVRLIEAARGNGLKERDASCRASAFYSTPHYTSSLDPVLSLGRDDETKRRILSEIAKWFWCGMSLDYAVHCGCIFALRARIAHPVSRKEK